MKNYQILVSGYLNGYITSELITVNSDSLENAACIAESISKLDGASAII